MMTPQNSSPVYDSSSDSTSPPSETTLADGLMAMPELKASKTIVIERSQRSQISRPSSSGYDKAQSEHTINSGDDSESVTSDVAEYENAECAFLAHARTNKVDEMKSLLESKMQGGLNLNLNYKGNQKQNYSWSAMHLACYFGHERIVELLLSDKQLRDELDINIRNSSGDTPLHKATLTNRVNIVQSLLSNGANVFLKNCDGMLAKQLTSDKHIFKMLEASEQADRNLLRQNMFKAVDNGDLRKLQEYFRNYDILRDAPEPGLVVDESSSIGASLSHQEENMLNDTFAVAGPNDVTTFSSADFANQMTDERGNTLLHLAAMRGFKAICIYLLEHGFDPYKKNNLGQTCIELSSYQLRQLFMSVKPAVGQLNKLSKQRVTRFEGPLLRKVRILGWKQMYVVLENGVLLLFNNRRDSMNRARRGYKYLESATYEPDPSDLGMFTVRFSDNSRSTFLVSASHLNYYTTFKLTSNENNNCSQKAVPSNQLELIRQKWLDSLRDHIVYSTELIRKGLKLNDDDDVESMNYDGGNLVTINHLLPIDTIKSFVHEARAHYSILERHAESLCILAQSISTASQQNLTNSLEISTSNQRSSNRWVPLQQQQQSQMQSELDSQSNGTTTTTMASSSISTGSRLLGFIRPARQQSRASLTHEDDVPSLNRDQSTLANNSIQRARNQNATNEFIQDNWPCLLFHLRLLMESSENTKTSMGQALALMEHQEQLRQNRIQDQEERCRVLENSLQTLARDHHELEKSLSMSQIYHSACRSISMSTDLNEYHDAFEDFDDEKTMTPNSIPSDEELDKRIRDVLNEKLPQGDELIDDPSNDVEYNDDAEDDLESNCSALTVETVTEQYLSATDITQNHEHQFVNNLKQGILIRGRTRLPAPMIPRDQVSIWSILKNCIGKELSKITMPVVFNEPLTMLQRSCEGLQYSHYLVRANLSDDPIERMELVCAFIVASLSGNSLRIIKPFNPLLYETYEIVYELEDGSHIKGLAQQVSHHPPITAAFAKSQHFTYNGVINPKIKFWGRSVEVSHDGACRIHLERHSESYTFKAVACSIHNIIVGKLWFEHHGPLDIVCEETNLRTNLTFKQAGWFSNDLHRFDGFISSGIGVKNPKKLRFMYGKWTDYIKSVDYTEYEDYMRDNQQKLFKIPDDPDQGRSKHNVTSVMRNLSLAEASTSVNNNIVAINEDTQIDTKATTSSKSGDKKSGYTKSESTHSLDIPNSRTLWRLDTQFMGEYYNFSLFTMKLNELTPELEKTLPRTDSRFRPDVRKLEEGDLDGAANEKQRLEEKQREIRSRDKRFKDPSNELLWFEAQDLPGMKEKFYIYKGGYWENKCNPEKFPDLF